jgi:uncharacterized protein (TIGR03437 family)
MGHISVRITDSLGGSRLAPLLYTSGGWGFVSFIVPDNTAPGPAEIAIIRTDGSMSTGRSIVTETAPGLRSATSDGRGAASAMASQRFADGSVRTFDAFRCAAHDCRPAPIPLVRSVYTTLRLVGTGFRHANSIRDLRVTVGESVAPVLSFGPLAGNPGSDQITVRLTDNLIGAGEQDLVLSVHGALSDVVRIACGGSR